MIYLDNAATTWPKPPQVLTAAANAQRNFGANPGRSGHKMSIAAAEELYRCRKTAAELFHAPGPECVAFTMNCTMALNMAIKGLVKPGDHVVTSCLEHNAVMRPLQALTEKNVTFTQALVVPGDNDATVANFRKALKANTRLIVCMQASNVWGIRLPVERIAAMAKEYDIPMIVDCAQSAGVIPINMEVSRIEYLCTAGHKGLYGPMGTGLLIAASDRPLATIIEGGTGTVSDTFIQPETMPDRMESGTQNLGGIAGLRAGMEFVKSRGVNTIFRHEMQLTQMLYDRLSKLDGVILYTARPDEQYCVPVLSFNVEGKSSEGVSQLLSDRGIAVRAGLHCAPSAHRFMGTEEQGVVRVCPSAFTNSNEINAFVINLNKIIRK